MVRAKGLPPVAAYKYEIVLCDADADCDQRKRNRYTCASQSLDVQVYRCAEIAVIWHCLASRRLVVVGRHGYWCTVVVRVYVPSLSLGWTDEPFLLFSSHSRHIREPVVAVILDFR